VCSSDLVDVERFEDDSQEPMAARGMGVIYEKTHDLKPLRRLLTSAERVSLLSDWYLPHHKNLTAAVDRALELYGKALVIDAHSFLRVALPYETDPTSTRPEICIGSDSFHTPTMMTDSVRRAFERQGFNTGVNTPFAGSIVPAKHFRRDKRVASIMIELRRDLYLDELTGSLKSSSRQIKHRLKLAILDGMSNC
jgi:N-formylglutamate amidohydrolase